MITNEILRRISNEYGSECYIFDCDEVRKRAREIKEIIGTKLVYSIKANPFIVPSVLNECDALEVCSPGELAICKRYRVDGSRIIYSGVNKGEEDITEALEYGVSVITLESIRHYEILKELVQNSDYSVRSLIRLSAKNQFGMSREDAEYIISDSLTNDHIAIEGIHYFAGTQRAKLKHQVRELDELKETIISLREKFGIELRKLEYGTGFYYPYFQDEDSSDTLKPCRDFAYKLREMSEICDVTVEMGRFIASSCGYYLATICDVKESYGHKWCILDGGMNHINYYGQMMGLKIPKILFLDEDLEESNNSQTDKWTLCGSLCTSNDILVREFPHGKLKIGDRLVFCNLGAYSVTEGIDLFLSRTMPRIIIFENGTSRLVRDRFETYNLNADNKYYGRETGFTCGE